MASSDDAYFTRASLFLRINGSQPREVAMAWDEFRDRYARVISGFARNLGAKPQDVDDLVQDVMIGFFQKSPSFVYDPSKGRFRGYLKVCTFRALKRRREQDQRFTCISDEQLDESSGSLDAVWNDLWEQRLMERAVSELNRLATPEQVTVFQLCVLDGKSAEEAATLTGLGIEAVYKVKQRTTARFREILSLLVENEP